MGGRVYDQAMALEISVSDYMRNTAALNQALEHLATLVNVSDRGHPKAEAFLDAHGWRHVEGHGRVSPEKAAGLPTPYYGDSVNPFSLLP